MTGYNGSPPRLRDVPHRIVAVHYPTRSLECSCGWTLTDPELTYDGLRDAYTAHRQEMGQRSGHAHEAKPKRTKREPLTSWKAARDLDVPFGTVSGRVWTKAQRDAHRGVKMA